MNKSPLILLSLFLFTACKKDNDNNPKTGKNAVTYTTGGKTYTVNESTQIGPNMQIRPAFVDCIVMKSSNGYSLFTLLIGGTNLPFNMQILSPEGNANGLGKFTFKNSGYDIIDERFSGGQSYQIVGGEVNLTESSSTKIVGSYNVLLKSGSNTKSATGTFTINQPIQ